MQHIPPNQWFGHAFFASGSLHHAYRLKTGILCILQLNEMALKKWKRRATRSQIQGYRSSVSTRFVGDTYLARGE
jgi:hypothetical protein